MFNTRRCSKSLSCESLFYERSSLKRKLIPSTTPNNISFKNDDYNYLINCNELIKTCKEALLENESPVIAALTDFAITDRSDRSNTKIQQIDHTNTTKTQELQKHSYAEFLKWLNYTELQLESVCYCANKNKNNTSINWDDIVNHHKALQTEIENLGRRFINEIKNSGKGTKETKEERRWHTLWLKSLEYLMIVEQGAYCPQHYNCNSVDEQLVPSKKLKNNVGIAASDLGRINEPGRINDPGRIKNKRVQTKTTMVGQSKDALLSNYNGGSKFEIIQKDIGYSSDADMSDAVDAHPHSDQNNLNRTVRKRQVRRRRSRAPRTRPWSFHSDWTDWDYYQTPLNYDYNLSTENFYYEDDNVIRNLIEFGENYETWISNDDDDLIRVSTPLLSHTSSENEPKLSGPVIQEVSDMTLLTDTPNNSQVNIQTNDANTTTTSNNNSTRRSSMHFALTFFIFAAAMAILAISMTNFSPHIEKIYPNRPPPI